MNSRHRQLLGAPIAAREITPEAVYLRRRELGPDRNGTGRSSRFARRGLIGGGAAWAAGAALTSVARPVLGAGGLPPFKKSGWGAGEKLTPLEDITSYNNFYEFGTGKDDPRKWAHTLRTRPWTVSFEGEIGKPQTMAIDALLKLVPLEERIYRLRCVEAWSMVIPWIGIPLAPVVKRLEPTSRAKFVAFSTLLAPDQMPGQKDDVLAWPYVEGLRIDEAMHPLTILAVGLYGKVLPNQNGAPIRLVVPWKYGFKSIKSVVKLRFVEKQPPTSWNLSAPREYGFYSNVNPEVDHPRWSQARERRIGQFRKMTTLPFNGYGGEVASLYSGMDLRANF